MAIFTESIWQAVSGHTWKYRARSRPVNGIIWHTTRGGQNYDGDTEIGAALNWFRSPNNRVHQPPFDDYAGISHTAIGPSAIVEVVQIDGYIPAWSSHPSDEHAISVEVAQSNLGQPIEPATIANCRKFAEWASVHYGFPLGRTPSTGSDLTWIGEMGHEDTVQGKAQGKSDPGVAFWTPYMEDDMTPEQLATLARVSAMADDHEYRLQRIERDEVSADVPDAWLGPRLTLIETRLIALQKDCHIHPEGASSHPHQITVTLD